MLFGLFPVMKRSISSKGPKITLLLEPSWVEIILVLREEAKLTWMASNLKGTFANSLKNEKLNASVKTNYEATFIDKKWFNERPSMSKLSITPTSECNNYSTIGFIYLQIESQI